MDAPGRVVVSEAPLAEALEVAAGKRLVVLVPTADVRLTQIEVPSRQTAKALQAAPFLLEEQIADDVETLHFALGARLGAGQYPVAVVARDDVARWLAPLQAAGLLPDALVPDVLCLPPPDADGRLSALVDGDQVIVRSGAFRGFTCATEDLPFYLQAATGDAVLPTLTLWVTAQAGGDFTTLGVPLELRPGNHHPLETLIQHYRADRTINLLQGRYSRRESLARLWRPWRLVAGLLLAVFSIAVAANAVWAWRLDHQAAMLRADNLRRFHQAFPDEPTSLDLSLAVQQEEQQQSGGKRQRGLLNLLQQIAAGLKATGGLTVSDLQYREGALYADLTGNDLQALEKLRDWFRQHHDATLDVQSANADGGAVQIRIKLSAP